MKLLVDLKERRNEPVAFGDDFKNPKTFLPVENYSGINWAKARFAYFGPEDPRIVRQMPKPIKGTMTVHRQRKSVASTHRDVS